MISLKVLSVVSNISHSRLALDVDRFLHSPSADSNVYHSFKRNKLLSRSKILLNYFLKWKRYKILMSTFADHRVDVLKTRNNLYYAYKQP